MNAALRRFLSTGSAGGIVLALAALAALVSSNSPLAAAYQSFVAWPVSVPLGFTTLAKPLVVWVNDLWMAVFFLLVGLELKREALAGALASPRRALLPAVAACAGMAVPALIYAGFNHADPVALRGWAIPSATDIAFALGVLALLGPRVPPALKVFLTAVAVIDDLGAIVVIALFYTQGLSLPMLLGAAACIGALAALNRAGVTRVAPYLAVGLVLWFFVLKSGVHATLAGVVTALAIPLRGGGPLERLEHALAPWVAFLVLPVFAFVNAGVPLAGVSLATLAHPVPLGIAAGLVVGKTLGIFGAAMAMVRWAGVPWPEGATRRQLLAVCVLCGIGFTMSLFIGGLAFDGHGEQLATELKLGVLGGSLVAGMLGALLFVGTRRRADQ